MKSKFILTVAATLLAGTVIAGAQTSGQPSNNNDRSGQPTDSSTNSAQPVRPGATQGQGGTMNNGGAMQRGPAMGDQTPAQPGGVSPSAPPQGAGGGNEAQPRPR
jgi:hypothetical protein